MCASSREHARHFLNNILQTYKKNNLFFSKSPSEKVENPHRQNEAEPHNNRGKRLCSIGGAIEHKQEVRSTLFVD